MILALFVLLGAMAGLLQTFQMMLIDRAREVGIWRAIGTPAPRLRGLIAREVGLVLVAALVAGVGTALPFADWASQMFASFMLGASRGLPSATSLVGVVTASSVVFGLGAWVARRATAQLMSSPLPELLRHEG